MKKTALILFVFLLFVGLFEACNFFANANNKNNEIVLSSSLNQAVSTTTYPPKKTVKVATHFCITETEKKMIAAGLIDIKTIDTGIVVDLRYSTKNNFLGIDMYGDFNKCYLQADVAQKLKCAQGILRSKFPFYNLIVFDAVRARSIQRKMWDTINVPSFDRSKYVSNPNNGSLHNFGAAIDVSIIDENGIELDMGTPYDFFGELAYPREEDKMIEEGKLTHIQLLNRKLLRDVLESSGFMGITTEWWHFNACYRTEAYEKYKIIE